MKRVSILLFILSLSLCSCSRESEQTQIESINGIMYIHNTEIPSNTNKTVVFKKELTITGKNEKEIS